MKHLAVYVSAGLLLAQAAAGDYAERPEVADYVDEVVTEHGFDRAWVNGVFAGAKRSEAVLKSISRPAEKAKPWHAYRDIFIIPKRVALGAEFWREHGDTLARAEAEYGVAADVVVAIIGVETYYGDYMGSHRVIDSLATLAFDYPPRSSFFRGQLTQFLLLVQEEKRDPFSAMGSYAGAMGYGQFIPSSYRDFAVDFDGDGVRDIWENKVDAIGSVANYFAVHGWRGESPAVVRVALADAAAAGGVDAVVNQGLDLNHTVSELRELGVTGAESLPGHAKAALYRMAAADGDQYWLAMHDFYVITRYNRSAMYALAVLQLAGEIRKAYEASENSPG